MLARIFGLTVEILATRWHSIFRAILLPSIILVLVNTFAPWATQSVLILTVLRYMTYSWLAVTIHRAILLNENISRGWGWRETRFAGSLIVVSVALVLAISGTTGLIESIGFPVGGAVGTFLEFGVAALFLYWVSQYFLIFPAIAVDHKYSISSSAVATEDHRMDAFIVVAVFPALLSLIMLPGTLISNSNLFSFVTAMLSIVSITIGITMLSVLYRELVQGGT